MLSSFQAPSKHLEIEDSVGFGVPHLRINIDGIMAVRITRTAKNGDADSRVLPEDSNSPGDIIVMDQLGQRDLERFLWTFHTF